MSERPYSHFALINGLSEFCVRSGLSIYEHQYCYLSFGSWILVVGRSHKRLRFSWDGKEGLLTIEHSNFESQSCPPSWKSVAAPIKGDGMSEKELLEKLKFEIGRQYAA